MSRYFPPLLPDDPRITAYALGELDADERAFVEKALEKNPDLEALVDEIRESSRLIETALEIETGEKRSASQATPPTPAAVPHPLRTGKPEAPHSKPPAILRFPQLYFVIGGMAAAGFAVLVALRPEPKPQPQPLQQQPKMLVQGYWSAKEIEEEPAKSEANGIGGAAPAEKQLFGTSEAEAFTQTNTALPANRPVTAGVKFSASMTETTPDANVPTRNAKYRGERRLVSSRQVYLVSKTSAQSEDSAPALRLGRLVETATFVPASTQPSIALDLHTQPSNFEALREELLAGSLPKPSEVDVGSILGSYAFSKPESLFAGEGNAPLSFSSEVAPAPWNPRHRLARIEIRTRERTTETKSATPAVKKSAASIDFDPEAVSAYRVIGYDLASGRPAATDDLGPSRSVTYLVELEPVRKDDSQEGSATPENQNRLAVRTRVETGQPLFTFRLSWVDPENRKPVTESHVVKDSGLDWERSSADFKFAASIGAFGMLLRQTPEVGTANFPNVERWAEQGLGSEQTEERRSFIDLVRKAQELER